MILYAILTATELVLLLILFLLSWIAGAKASSLIYCESNQRLHRRARKQLFWAGTLTVLSAAILIEIAALVIAMQPVFWTDRAFLHAPLVGLPIISVLALSVPKLVRLRKRTRNSPEAAVGPNVRAFAAEPAMTVPFQATALGSIAAFYYAMVPPVPFHWTDAIPAVLFLPSVAGLWFLQRRRRRSIAENGGATQSRPWIRLFRGFGIAASVIAVSGVLIYFAQERSRLPGRIDMMSGSADYGGGVVAAHHEDGAVPLTELTGPRSGIPDRKFTLTAEKKTATLSSGKRIEAWTFSGQIPGPELRMEQGELIEVTLLNKDIDEGATIHWHGLDVPNAEDGVAGVTQDAVMPGESYTYRFVAEQSGTFWYHTHQHSKEGVDKGLFGPLIVEPKVNDRPEEKDITVITHLWGSTFAIGSFDTVERVSIPAGTPVRLRLINTDNWIRQNFLLSGAPFQVAAIDGTDLHEPGTLENTRLELTTGSRFDVTFIMPDSPVFLSVGNFKGLGLFMSPDGSGDIPDLSRAFAAASVFHPSAYGGQTETSFAVDSDFDREFTMVLDNGLGFYNGRLDYQYTINGEVFPNTPSFVVREGDLVKTTIVNRGNVDHPMHLHGHHMLVLTHNGKPVQGTWWSDTLDVLAGDTFEVAFRADNPGMWMDHCHNLVHAQSGMSMHLMYEGVGSSFKVGTDTGNHPE
jgi:FtsP/CotA-like multicopper oxidase with cupredoxin domain